MRLFNFCLTAAIVCAVMFFSLLFAPTSIFNLVGVTNLDLMSGLKVAPLALVLFFILLGLYPSYTKKRYALLIGSIIGTSVVGTTVMGLLIWKFGLWQVWVACVAITILTGIALGVRWLYKQVSLPA